ncbi:hypothetical protein AVEN_153655-1 [Araneus ventricosus]|uniref:Uncharacterized protein n=1 Tax=Araneus ventricosus TaxID=182803 RepID=A0A4Y2BQI4_ARAVE|nr:hypothetical protein AVEN_153655-1 [Araneus ventricosus]
MHRICEVELEGPQWPSGKVLVSGPEGFRPQTRLHRRSAVPVASDVVTKYPPAGVVVRKFGEGVPAQVPSSSSDRGSKLRGPDQNSPRVASKRDVSIIKLNSAELDVSKPIA